MHIQFKYVPIATLAIVLSTAVAGSAVQIIVAPTCGGFLADDNGDGVFDRALPGEGFGVGKANNFSNIGSREYQGAYEWNLFDPLIIQVNPNQIQQVTLTFSRTVYGANSTAPNLVGVAAGYVGNGAFGFEDVDSGIPVATFPIWNHFKVSLPQPDPVLDVTTFFISTRASGNQYLGFNLRTDDSLPPGTTVDNFFVSPRLTIVVVPEPSTTSLAVSILACTAHRRCVRKTRPYAA